MNAWESLHVAPEIIQALEKVNFTIPTPIQEQVLPCAIKKYADVLGAAPTGSGKTLAFGIPLIMRVLELKRFEAPNLTENEVNYDSPDILMLESNQFENTTSSESNKAPKRKSKKRSNIYSCLDIIEELDADTGEVRATYSLGDCQLPSSTASDNEDERLNNNPLTNSLTESKVQANSRIYGLVLLPTRELAVQVCKHLRMLTEFCQPEIRIETILGGMSIQKQTRILQRCPDIVVATPGRLWHFIQDDEPHISTLRHVNVLVVDEADKLVEANHFEDLRALFNWLHSEATTQVTKANPEILPSTPKQDVKKNHKRRRDNSKIPNHGRQTLVFSATLTFVHQGALKPGSGATLRKKMTKLKGNMTTKMKLGMLRQLLGLRPDARIIDFSIENETQPTKSYEGNTTEQVEKSQPTHISKVQGALCTPDGLQEFRLLCPDQASKDIRLFWFLSFGRHEACPTSADQSNQRCLIFLNSKAGVRRLAGVMRQLIDSSAFRISQFSSPQCINVLHAGMVQKQRLRALERFQADPNGILIASDVAARGLDLATMDSSESGGVPWVLHFEVPHTAELYIHRRGRTARAHRSGFSVLFICPNEAQNWHRLAISLRRSELDLDDFTISPSDRHLTLCNRIVHLARQLDLLEHSHSRDAANQSWLQRAAKEADILLDSDSDRSDDDDDGNVTSGRKNKKSKLDTSSRTKTDQQIRNMKFQMIQLIEKSRSYILKRSNIDSGAVKTKLHSWSKKKILKKIKL